MASTSHPGDLRSPAHRTARLDDLLAHQTIADSSPLDRYGAAACWMGAHSRAGDLVFQTDWDDFPRLFFYDTTNVYVVGLDPTYLQLADENVVRRLGGHHSG